METCGGEAGIAGKPAQPKKIRRNRRQLSLEERIAVIERFEMKNASCRSLAEAFRCGRTQIKGILRNRQLHLAAYRGNQQQQPKPAKKPKAKHIVEVVLYESVQRALNYEVHLTDEILLSFARDIASYFNVWALTLDEKWLAAFKRTYKLTENNYSHPKQRKGFATVDKRKPLTIDFIIQDLQKQYGNDKMSWINALRSKVEGSESGDDHSLYGTDADNDYVDVIPLIQDEDSEMQLEPEEAVKEITSFREALNHLGPLEQFALMQENIRAIGLINQLENLFRDQMEESV